MGSRFPVLFGSGILSVSERTENGIPAATNPDHWLNAPVSALQSVALSNTESVSTGNLQITDVWSIQLPKRWCKTRKRNKRQAKNTKCMAKEGRKIRKTRQKTAKDVNKYITFLLNNNSSALICMRNCSNLILL